MILRDFRFRLLQYTTKSSTAIVRSLLTLIFLSLAVSSRTTVESGMIKLGRMFYSQPKQQTLFWGNKVQMMSSSTESFSTRVSIRPLDWKIDHRTPIHLIGSCFTDTISSALKKEKFDCFSNGQGIMFNPVSISGCLNNVLKGKLAFYVRNCYNN